MAHDIAMNTQDAVSTPSTQVGGGCVLNNGQPANGSKKGGEGSSADDVFGSERTGDNAASDCSNGMDNERSGMDIGVGMDQLAAGADPEADVNVSGDVTRISGARLSGEMHRRDCNRFELGDEVLCECDMCLLGFDDTQPDGVNSVNIRKKSVSKWFSFDCGIFSMQCVDVGCVSSYRPLGGVVFFMLVGTMQ